MSNLELYNQVFADIFALNSSEVNESISRESLEVWDSLHQFSLISAIEETFFVILSPDDILEFNSYNSGMNILIRNGIDL